MLRSALPQKLSLGIQIAAELVAISIVAGFSIDVLAVVGYLPGFTAISFAIAFAIGDVFALSLSPLVGRGNRIAAVRTLIRTGTVAFLGAVAVAVATWFLQGSLQRALLVPEVLSGSFATVYLYFCIGFLAKVLIYIAFGALRAFGRIVAYSQLNVAVALSQPVFLGLALVILPAPSRETVAHLYGISYAAPYLLGFLAVCIFFLLGEARAAADAVGPTPRWADDIRPFFGLALSVTAIALLSPSIVAATGYLVAQTGPEVVAAFAVVSKLQPFLFVGLLAWVSTLSVALGQNLGARSRERSIASYQLACAYVIAWQLGIGVVVILSAELVADFFAPPGAGREFLLAFCHVVPIGYGFWAVASMATKVFNLLKSPARAVASSVFRNFGLVLPCLFAGFEVAGAEGILWGLTIGNVAAGAILYPIALRSLRSAKLDAGPGAQRAAGDTAPD